MAFDALQCVDAGVLLHSQSDDLHSTARERSRRPFGFEVIKPQGLLDALSAHGERLMRCAASTASSK